MALPKEPFLLVTLFLEHLEVERNVSRLTIRNYSLYLRRFCSWLKDAEIDDVSNIDKEIIRKYRLYLARYTDDNGQTLSKRTQSYYIIGLRSWLKWLVKNDVPVIQPEKIDLPKPDAHQMKFLPLESIERLLAQPSPL